MTGPTAQQWRAAANVLREHAAKLDALAEVELPAPLEQLVATYNAVHAVHDWDAYDTRDDVIEYLRSVKP